MPLTRRDFLKSAAVGAAVAPWIRRTRLFAADAVKVRHASIGASGMGFADIDSFSKHPAFELVAVADVDLARTERVKEQFPQARIYQDWRELLKKERANLDSINVSTPDHMHGAIAMAAMRTGLHVYVQKPLAATIRETRKLTEYARSHGVVSQMGIQISSASSQRAFETMIRAGAIGKITEVHTMCEKSWGADGLLPAVTSPVPPTLDWDQWIGVGEVRPFQEGVYHPGEWRRRVGFGTGTLGDMGCHIFSPPFRALGLTAPISVTAHGPGPTKDNWATKARVHYVYPGSSLTAGNTVDLWWYDGGERPPDQVLARVGDRLPEDGLGRDRHRGCARAAAHRRSIPAASRQVQRIRAALYRTARSLFRVSGRGGRRGLRAGFDATDVRTFRLRGSADRVGAAGEHRRVVPGGDARVGCARHEGRGSQGGQPAPPPQVPRGMAHEGTLAPPGGVRRAFSGARMPARGDVPADVVGVRITHPDRVLTARVTPDAFTVKTVPAKLARLRRDPWADYWTCRRRLRPAMTKAFPVAVRPAAEDADVRLKSDKPATAAPRARRA